MGLFTERDEETTSNEIIIGKLNRIEAKLDAVIAALHEYDDDETNEFLYNTPSEALVAAKQMYDEFVKNQTKG
jgi:hypothetical protein